MDGNYYVSQSKDGFFLSKQPSLATLKTEEDVVEHYEDSVKR